MTTLNQKILIVAASLLTTVPAFAQTAPTAPAPAATPAPAAPAVPAAKVAVPGNVFYRGTQPGQYMAKDRLLGTNVTGKDGKIIGDIEDLILNANQEVEGVIIGVGGFLGAGEKKIGVRYSALQITRKDGKTLISLPQASKDVIASVDAYKRAEPAKSLLERAKDKAQSLTEKAKDTAGPALDKAKSAAGPALEKAKEAGKAVVEKGKEMIEGAKDKPAAPKQ